MILNDLYFLNKQHTKKAYAQIKEECEETDYIRMSCTAGDYTECGGRIYTRNSDEPVLVMSTKHINTSAGRNYYGYAFVTKAAQVTGTYNTYGDIIQLGTYTADNGSALNIFGMRSQWEDIYNKSVYFYETGMTAVTFNDRSSTGTVVNYYYPACTLEFYGAHADEIVEILNDYARATS